MSSGFSLRRQIVSVGALTMAAARDAGGIAVLAFDVARSLLPPTLDGRELVRNLYKMGYRSVPIVVMTALFVGALMVIQFAAFVKQYGATGMIGWGTGYAVLREVGPLLIGLMFSGRVGANNAAELGTMTVTDQIDGLLALAIDPVRYLIVPRVLAMMITLVVMTMIGDAVAILGVMLASSAILDVHPLTVWYGFVDNLGVGDFLHGLAKALTFGAAIALSSCYYGLTVRGGAVGVGRAVNSAVVSAAVSICFLDFLMTYLTA
ncbi:MAG TPA: ABC transporter permease [Kofleriaceae bacterium]|nr:ABC transporter permease [Kofleriaceae bacterium]